MTRKKILFIILVAVTIISCGRRSRDVGYYVSLMPCQDPQTEEYGYVDSKGNFVSTRFFDDRTPVINGYCVQDNTLYKVGKSISDTTPVLRNLVEYGIMNDGLMPICLENEHISVIDKDGHQVFTLTEFGGKEVRACYSYSNSKLRVELEDNTFVYVDKNGQQLFDHIYSYATDFKKGYAIAQTVRQNENLYSLIDNTGTPVFTFESEYSDYITISHDLRLLSTRIDDRSIIYDFKGKTILDCPSKVQEIYDFCYDGFIFMNDDDEFGLMSYDGNELIRAKYEQLVSHGNNYLALTDDDEILLINKKGTILKDWEGEEIFDFRYEGFEFPTIIETEDDGFIIIDKEGNIIYKIDEFWGPDGLSDYLSIVKSQYLPREHILNTIMEFCGNGMGLPDKYGEFFVRSGEHCYPRDIFNASNNTIKRLEGFSEVKYNVENGINYKLNRVIAFDEPIVNAQKKSLSTTAWLVRVALYLWMPSDTDNQEFQNLCVQELRKKGCEVLYKKNSDYILLSKDQQQIYVIANNWNSKEYEFSIQMMLSTDSNIRYWKTYIDNNKIR